MRSTHAFNPCPEDAGSGNVRALQSRALHLAAKMFSSSPLAMLASLTLAKHAEPPLSLHSIAETPAG
jgi:hypothetical protein